MAGYIGITAREWFTFLRDNGVSGEINFWRKNTKRFKVLQQGEPFFFLVKNEKGVKTERAVLGCATFERFEVKTVEDAWHTYKEGNGDPTYEAFQARMQAMFHTTSAQEQIGCIILSNVHVFQDPVLLSEVNIDFQANIVSGKSISIYEVERLQASMHTRQQIIRELQQLYDVGLTEDDDSFPEGRAVLRQHLVRERSKKLIKRAKELHLQKYGKLVCEVCAFDFEKEYGDIGKNYIEAHHTKPVSSMAPGEETNIEDIAMVCANCHRMLHRRRPWLTMAELRALKK